MSNYFVLFVKGEKGSPVSLEAVIQTEFYEKDPFRGSTRPPDASWHTTLHQKVELPDELWLITTDRMYSFDCHPYPGGFIVSHEFVELLREFNIHNYEQRLLYVVNKRKEPIKAKEYYFLKFHEGLDNAIDLEKSRYDLDKQGGYMKKIHELCLTEGEKPAAFVINSLVLSNRIFCSEDFKERATKLKLRGIAFVPVKESGNYKEYK